jgi:hypothetical protein
MKVDTTPTKISTLRPEATPKTNDIPKGCNFSYIEKFSFDSDPFEDLVYPTIFIADWINLFAPTEVG